MKESIIFIIFIIFLVIFIKIKKYLEKKKEMGVLTGKVAHMKTLDGIVIKVEFKMNKKIKAFRVATSEEIKILQKFKYL